MKQNYLLLVFLFIAGLHPLFAQTISSQKGLTTAIFDLPEGTITVYLPDDIRAGDLVSGTVLAVPGGKNARKAGKNLSALKRYSIDLDGQRSPLSESNGRLQFRVNDNKPLQRFLSVINGEGVNAGEVGIKISAAASSPTAICSIPTHALTAAPLRITGPFDGNSSNTTCTISGNAAAVLAESPRQCIIQYPETAGGKQTIKVTENDQQKCARTISGVDLHVSTGKLNLRRGERTFIKVEVTGLQNLPDTAKLTLVNWTTDIVEMQPSNNFLVLLAPDSVAAGNYERNFDVQSIKPGSFTVNVELDLPQPATVYASIRPGVEQPPVYAEVKRLDKPRKLEDKAIQIGLDMALKKLEADAAGARGKEYDKACQDCRDCISSRMGEWAADLVHDLGMIVIKEFAGKAISMIAESAEKLKKMKEFIDKANDKIDNAEKLGDELQDMIKKGELKYVPMKEVLCAKNKDCLNKADVFYNPATSCVFAIITCRGTAKCCDGKETTFYINYCTDEKGLPNTPIDIEVIIK